ncbi:MAG: FAD:protein FMN transferase [Bacteroidales bacterium]|nr:FAD:protein FMN transferase [Bacteroidales bacterium]
MRDETEFINDGAVFHGSVHLVMGTRLDLITCGAPLPEVRPVWAALLRSADRIGRLLDRFSPDSELSRLNTGAMQGVGVSREMAEVLRLAEAYWEQTGGLFDVSGGFMSRIEVTERDTVSLYGHPLDFGGFAKGYFLREAAGLLREAGIKDAYLDFGGSSIWAAGCHPFGDCWKVSLPDPYTGIILDEMALRDQAMSTSGNTPRYSGHIRNPLSGAAVTERKLTVVTAPDPLDAEILSTAYMVADEGQRALLRLRFPKAQEKIYT